MTPQPSARARPHDRPRGWTLCVPSQNGARPVLPQRHRAIVRRSRGTAAPSASTTSAGPRTSSGPSGQTVMVTSGEGVGGSSRPSSVGAASRSPSARVSVTRPLYPLRRRSTSAPPRGDLEVP